MLRRTYERETTDWLVEVHSNASEVFWSSAEAANNFIVSAKLNNYINPGPLHHLNLMCGDGLDAMRVPILSTIGDTSSTVVGFVEADYAELTGLSSDSSPKYLETGVFAAADLSEEDTHHSMYVTSAPDGSRNAMGANGGGGTQMILFCPNTTDNIDSNMYDGGAGNLFYTPAVAPLGLIHGTREGEQHKLYQEGVEKASVFLGGGSLPNLECLICTHNVITGPDRGPYGDHVIGAYSYGSAFNPSMAVDFATDMSVFQTRMGRAI